MIRRPPRSTLFPTRRSSDLYPLLKAVIARVMGERVALVDSAEETARAVAEDRKSTRLNSSHGYISYAVFCLKKKKKNKKRHRGTESNGTKQTRELRI